jgi:rhodanese-related sulfurtransferase
MQIKNIDAKTAKNWLESKQAVIVDVREPAENNSASIKDSHLIPVGKICKQNLPKLEGKKLIIHCQKGARGSNACQKLISEDSSLEIYNLEGGIEAWKNAGFEIKSSGKFFLSIDRQVQLIIGIFVLLGSVLGYLVNPVFFLLSAFFGLGLTFAGITGFCGLALLVAKMPWNKGKSSCYTKTMQ